MADLLKEQYDLETQAITQGVQRYQKLVSEAPRSTTLPGTRLIAQNTEALSKAIKEVQLLSLDPKGKGKLKGLTTVGHILRLLDSDTLAVLTLLCLFNETVKNNFRDLALKISKASYFEYKWNSFKKDNPEKIRYIYQNTKKINSSTLTYILRKEKYYASNEWSKTEQIFLGTLLIYLALEYTTLFRRYQVRAKNGKGYEYYLDLSEDAWTYLKEANSDIQYWRPILPPMIVPPKAWSLVTGKGGYNHIDISMVKARPNGSRYTSEDCVHLRGMNIIQSTRYRVNPFILSTMQQVWSEGGSTGDLPPARDLPLPPKPRDIATNAEAKSEWKAKAVRVYDQNASFFSRRRQTECKLKLAEEFKDRDIYLPVQPDFRGRQYYLPNYLHPQGEDSTRALLNFGERVAMNDDGIRWLKIHMANCWGHDKLPYSDRIRWVDDNLDFICEAAEAPLTGSQGWTSADKPWLFLAACHEFIQGERSGWSGGTTLPVGIDGTCNGLQHYAAMGLDPVAAQQVNLTSTSEPRDIYQSVLDVVQRSLDRGDDPRASQWLRELTRKTVKRGVMTYPYGVTPYGMVEAIVNDGFCDPLDGNPFSNGHYLMQEIWKALPQVIESASVIMEWLQKCAITIAKQNKPVVWVTPSGFMQVQEYTSSKARQVDTILQKVAIIKDGFTDPIDERKMALAMGPNTIHAFDSSHLMATACSAYKSGIRSLMANHDQYNTHAPNIPCLGYHTRDEFVRMYSVNQMERLKDQLEYYSDTKLPEPPARGDFNIREVYDSEYFFG